MDNIPIMNDTFLGDFLNSFTISQQMVYNKLINLNSGKPPGPDGWHPCLLKDIAGNHRPVSLTSVICKVMESIVRDKTRRLQVQEPDKSQTQ